MSSASPESEIALLKQQLREQRERAEKAESRVEDAESRVVEAESRAEIEKKKTKSTTLDEFIYACHIFLTKQVYSQKDKKQSTKGSITNPKNRLCPTLLKPWTDFPVVQQQIFEEMYKYIPQDEELFSSTHHLAELAKGICDRPLASEKDFELYQRLAVEKPTTDIIHQLVQVEGARRELNVRNGIMFENHANTLSDSNDEVQQSLQDFHITSKKSAPNSNPKPRYSDQICVCKELDGTRVPCMIVEYKPTHKLSVHNLRAGLLRADGGSMDILKNVINRTAPPTNPDEKFVYNSERLVAASLIQTYDYMMENGFEYSYIATPEAFVFLSVKGNEPHTLYYHLAEPKIQAEGQDGADIILCRTAVGQSLTFCLMALNSKPRNHIWREQALQNLRRVAIDHESILQKIPKEEAALSPPSSVFHARIHPFTRSPIMLRSKKLLQSKNSCGAATKIFYEDPQSPTGSSDETSDIETPSQSRIGTRLSRTEQKHQVKSSQGDKHSDVRHRNYCTQACLLGLVRRQPLDDACPNVGAHRVHTANNNHALGRRSLMKHMLRQITADPEDGCEPLGKQGARGALFKLTLKSYGYVFVAKGTVAAFQAKLEHEGSVYRRLDQIQGELIPVYLGNIYLKCPYYLAVGVRIIHMLLMSYAGEEACQDLMQTREHDLTVETDKAVTTLRDYGIEHCDVRSPNVLWNLEIGKVMLIDFERSEFLKQISVSEPLPKHSIHRNPFKRSKFYSKSVSMSTLLLQENTVN